MNSTGGVDPLFPLLHLQPDLLCLGDTRNLHGGGSCSTAGHGVEEEVNVFKWSPVVLGLVTVYLILKGLTLLVTYGVKYVITKFTFSMQLTGSMEKSCSCCDNDQVYHALLKHLGKYFPASLHTQKIAARTISSKAEDDCDSDPSDSDDEQYRPSPDYEWAFHLAPTLGYGVNYITHKNVWIRINRRLIPSSLAYKTTQELLTLTSFVWNKDIVQALVEDAKPHPKKVDSKSHTVIYKAHMDGYWSRLGGPKKKRPLDSLILESKVIQKLVADVKSFLTMEDWYVERGIPYRRGYLLYGPPGCGKSSVIKAIAGELNYNICVFSLSQKLTDDGLTQLFNTAPERSIILLEDIDAAFKSREQEGTCAKETNLAFEGCSPSALTFMGLLNSLDGVASADDGQLVFMTTNYPERLDPALIRAGRVDMKIAIGYPNDVQIAGMFRKFFPSEGNNEGLVAEFVSCVRSLDLKVSMAMLQGLLLVYRDDPKEAIAQADDYFKEQFTNSNLARERISALYC